jgi:hypothetical protein
MVVLASVLASALGSALARRSRSGSPSRGNRGAPYPAQACAVLFARHAVELESTT